MTMLSIFGFSVALSLLLLFLTKVLSSISDMDSQKWMTFECGFDSQTPSHNSFSMQFFLVMILFLIFDIEISLIFPFSFSNPNTKMAYTMIIFIFILILGLLYEWSTDKLNWSK